MRVFKISINDYLRDKIVNTKELVENIVYDEKGKKYPKRNFWLIIEKNINGFFSKSLDNDKFNFVDSKKTRILLLPGLRGVGKTTGLLQAWDYLVNTEKIPQENVLYISIDEVKQNIDSSIYEMLKTFVEKIHDQKLSDIKKKLFILIDESHFDDNWDRSLKIIYDIAPKNLFIIATGSSTISIQAGPDLARRSFKETVFPLKFSEYLIMKYKFYPQKGTAEAIRNVIFNPSVSNIQHLNSIESINMRKLLSKMIDVKKSLREFVFYGGFADGINMSRFDVYQRINEVVDKTITKDLPKIHNFTLNSQNDIIKLITFLSLQTTGKSSRESMSRELGIAVKKVDQILNALEQSHLIFSVKPKGPAMVRKPWKYYFMSPTLNAALYNKVHSIDMWNNGLYGKLIENLFAFYLFRMSYNMKVYGIFYDANENSADFIMGEDPVVPIEIGVGNKNIEQIKNSMRNHKKSEYGIIIHNCEKAEMKGKVLHIPLTTFAFL